LRGLVLSPLRKLDQNPPLDPQSACRCSTFWEHSDKPPRSDVLPKLAKVLGASVEQLLGISPIGDRRPGPIGKTQRVFEEVARLPRSQQDKILEIVSALVDQYKRKAS
jgi:hypothetical protein